MIRDKNIFECVFKDNKIWFPNYVVWGPPSHGHKRRKQIFSQSFPNTVSQISTSNSWSVLRKRHNDKRRIFKYDETTKTLNEINKHSFFITALGILLRLAKKLKQTILFLKSRT